jgi:hypothetical protein
LSLRQRFAEALYARNNRGWAYDENGRPHMQGLVGRWLERQDRERLSGVRWKLRRTEMGQALLAFMYDEGLTMCMDRHVGDFRAMGKGAHIRGATHIHINATAPDDILHVFAAHEAHHAAAHRRMARGAPEPAILAPRAGMAAVRFIEAAAYVFTENYARDYCARTGENDALAHLRFMGMLSPDSCRTDAQRFAWHVTRLAGSTYDIEALENHAGVVAENGQWLLGPEDSRRAVLALARAVDDGAWPATPPAHYLRDIPDKDILNLGFWPARGFEQHIREAERAYADTLQKGRAPAP